MMDSKSGEFKPLPPEFGEQVKEEIQTGKPSGVPFIYVGEIVDVKGVKFLVRDFRPNGKLRLRMVKDPGVVL